MGRSRRGHFETLRDLSLLLTFLILVSGCSSRRAIERTTPDAGVDVDAAGCELTEASSPGGACHTQGQLVLDLSQIPSPPPWGPPITVSAGSEPAPLPTGGPLVDGLYQLVAETVFGPPSPQAELGHPGAQVHILLAVQCDVYNREYTTQGAPENEGSYQTGGGRLTLSPDPTGQSTPYTSTGNSLYLFSENTYFDSIHGHHGLDLDLDLGSYELIDEYTRTLDATAGPATPCGPPAPDPSRRLAAGMRDPGCPSNPPVAGTPCNPQPAPLECEYGGDLEGRCTVVAACSKQGDAGFAFAVDSVSPCPQNAPDCPPTFAAARARAGVIIAIPADAGAGPSFSCAYLEGECDCIRGLSSCTWACRARGDVTSSVATASCPANRPLAGDPCQEEGQCCAYGTSCSGVTLGPSLTCGHGNWAITDCPGAVCPPLGGP